MRTAVIIVFILMRWSMERRLYSDELTFNKY